MISRLKDMHLLNRCGESKYHKNSLFDQHNKHFSDSETSDPIIKSECKLFSDVIKFVLYNFYFHLTNER